VVVVDEREVGLTYLLLIALFAKRKGHIGGRIMQLKFEYGTST